MKLIDPFSQMDFDDANDTKQAIQRIKTRVKQSNVGLEHESGNFFNRNTYKQHARAFKNLYKPDLMKRFKNIPNASTKMIDEEIEKLYQELQNTHKHKTEIVDDSNGNNEKSSIPKSIPNEDTLNIDPISKVAIDGDNNECDKRKQMILLPSMRSNKT